MRKLTLILLLFGFSLQAQPIRVMTYNIRFDNPADGVNQWSNRKEKVFRLLEEYSPDIIGVQEALYHQLTDISQALDQYEFFGAGRDDGKQKGEYSAVFIRKDRFKILAQNTFWLSKTPGVPGSKDWDAAITRVATWARLQDRRSNKVFLMMNTHFDHIGKESRRNSASLLKDSVASIGKNIPAIVTGDFNITRDKPPYAVLVDRSGTQLIDSAPADTPGTFCGFVVGASACNAIDYIFHTEQWESADYQVIDDNDGEHYPSDHLPVMVTLSLKE